MSKRPTLVPLPPPRRPLFEAEVTFPDPSNVKTAIAQLNDAGFDVEVLDWTDPYGSSFIWLIASCAPGDDDVLCSRLEAVVTPLGGDVDNIGTGPYRIKEAHDLENVGLAKAGYADPCTPEVKWTAATARQQAGLAYRVYSATGSDKPRAASSIR
jgi:hypothetical protein